jgi:hypothetical protein
MRHALALLGVFAVVVVVYSRAVETPFLETGDGTLPPAIASAEAEPENDEEALCAVLAHLEDAGGHTFGFGGMRIVFNSIDGHTLFGFAVVIRDFEGREGAFMYAYRAVVRVVPGSGEVTLDLWTGMGLGSTGSPDSEWVLPLSEFVPGL